MGDAYDAPWSHGGAAVSEAGAAPVSPLPPRPDTPPEPEHADSRTEAPRPEAGGEVRGDGSGDSALARNAPVGADAGPGAPRPAGDLSGATPPPSDPDGPAARTDDARPGSAEDGLPGEEGDGSASGGSGGRAHLVDRFWKVGFPALTAVLAVAVVLLLVAGRSAVLHTTDGDSADVVADPAAPGWQAVAEPTPVAVLLQEDRAGALVGITVLSLPGAGVGSIRFLPVGTVPADAAEERTLAEVAARDRAQLDGALESVLGFVPTETVTITPAQWEELTAPVSPVTVQNPDDVLAAGPDGRTVRFAKGALVLPAAEVADYLAIRSPDERDLNRMVRHEAWWRAWLEAVGRSDAEDAVPGERDTGLGWFVRQLARARLDVATLPVQVQPGSAGGAERYAPVIAQMRDALAQAVPFPVGSPGRRLRVRLLDGDGSLRNGIAAVPLLVRAGGQIDQIGNARPFGAPTTQLLYFDESRRRDVEALAAALEVGEIVKGTDNTGTTDVVVTLGRDFAARQAAGPVTTTTPTTEAASG